MLKDIDVHLVVPGPQIFSIPGIADSLDKVIAGYGITLHTESELTAVDADGRKVMVSAVGPSRSDYDLPYDMLHVVPRQSAPDWIKRSPLSTGDAAGCVEVDKFTLQHVRYPNVFALGDVASSPNAKTGAAVRKQAPVVVENIDAFIDGRPLRGSYDGYSSCPIVTSSHDMLLAEFDYDQTSRRRSLAWTRPSRTAPILVSQEVRAAVPVLEPDAQGSGLSIADMTRPGLADREARAESVRRRGPSEPVRRSPHRWLRPRRPP